jgi:hypothetical protein
MEDAATAKLSFRSLAEQLGMTPSSYAFYEDPKKFKKQFLPIEFAKQLVPPMTSHDIDMWDVLALAGFARSEDDSDPPRPKVKADEAAETLDLVPIGEVDLETGMAGTDASRIHYFPRTWLESISAGPPSMLSIAHARGDSMQPTIGNRDMVIINRAVRTIREQDAIWALTVGDVGMIKRVRMKGEKIILMSDRERIPPDEHHVADVNVVGRIDFVGLRK